MSNYLRKFFNRISAFFGYHSEVEPEQNEKEKEKSEETVADSSVFTILTPKEIGRKDMFYPESVNRQVVELRSILKPRNFLQACHRMKSKGLPSRFACLFYGITGTGKTETVMQLARQTGRDVMLIDTPMLHNKWLCDGGECLKHIFASYRKLASRSKRVPILFFNEANDLLGQRDASIEYPSIKAENNVKNMLLQELDSLDGIFVATTNLSGHLDSAFEHRFLYKIQFEQPSEDVRALIWYSMIPEVPQNLAAELAHRYKFSGGQIENVARKLLIDTVLHGSSAELSAILSRYYDTEVVTLKPARQRVGF